MLRSEDEKIARMFNDMKRSTAILKLAEMIRYKLIREDELLRFTEDTRARARELADANQGVQGTPAGAGAPDA
jgi:hypothetical protein